jgi:type IV pilus assembly protein PilM
MFDIRGLFSGGKQLAGLDIGSSCIKLAEIQDTPKGRILNRFSLMTLARGVIVDGAVAEPEVLTATIKELHKKSGCKRKNIVTSISGTAVIAKKVTFTQMDEEELRDLIRDEGEKYLPFDNMETAYYDFQILGENSFSPSQMDVLLVAAKKDMIDSYTEVIHEAGLIPVIMDCDSFALETMYEENYDFEENDVAVLINIGASMTNLNVVKGGMSIFTRDFTIGGNSVTEAIAEKLGIPFEEAEKAKIEGAGNDDQARKSFLEGLIADADPLCSEIERSVDYFRTTFGGENIKKILLSGGGSLIPGIAEDLSHRLSIEAEIVNPFKKIQLAKNVMDQKTADRIGPMAAVSVGLALRKTGDK